MFSPKNQKLATKSIVTWLVAIAGLSLAVLAGILFIQKQKIRKKLL
jgi:hypothetical protein